MQPTANRKVYLVSDVMAEIREAIQTICDPIISTLGVNGGNALYQNDTGSNIITNDGATIARYITVKDPLKDAVISIIKEGSLRTNAQAGDGTSTTALFAKNLTYRGFAMLKRGLGRREVIDALTEANRLALEAIKPTEWTDDKMPSVALVSASNNKEIADNTVKIVQIAGRHGFVSLEPSNSDTTTIEEGTGHVLEVGVMFKELLPDPSKTHFKVGETHVIVLGDRPYFDADAEHLIRLALNNNFSTIAVVAPDVLGDAVNSFITNHLNGSIQVLLYKVPDETVRNDLATYLGTTVISERTGKSLRDITPEDFIKVSGIMTGVVRTVINRGGEDSANLIALRSELQTQLSEDKENVQLQKRLGYLSSGIVTLKVGGGTPAETTEKLYKYEDAINAVRNAMDSGYVAGGGVGIRDSLTAVTAHSKGLVKEFLEELSDSTPRHLYSHIDTTELAVGQGIDLRTGEVVDMVQAGVIEPFSVAQNTIKNAVSVAKMIISLETIIVYDTEETGCRCISGQ